MGNKKKRTNKRTNKETKSKVKKSGKRTKNSTSTALVRKKDVKMKFKYKHPKLAKAFKIFFITFIVLVVVAAGIAIGLFSKLMGEEDFSIDIKELVLDDNSVIIDTDGNVLAELSGDENRKIITLEEMSPYLPKAYIAIEDERFRTHHGVDIKRTGKAILSFVTNFGKSTAGGGSTITQQVVKNVTQDKESKGVEGALRKLKEWIKAYQIEEVMSKDEILELYLNLIFVGGKENRGVEIGSQFYFNKSAKDLTIAECAFLAGINHSPNRYSPYTETDVTEKITKRTKTVLSQMKKVGYVTQEEYDAAIAEVDAGFKFQNGAKGNIYSAHTDALINQLINQIMEEKQISKNAAETYLYSSGLKIYSTQVTAIQAVMEEEVKKDKYVITSKKTGATTQAGMAVIEPSTGYVVGCVGQLGEKTTSRGINRALSVRQTGSSIKPLSSVIPGLEEGTITPATIYLDNRTYFGEYPPENYNDFTGKRNVRNALTTSQNIPFIKILAELSPAKGMEYLKKMGVTTLDEEKDNNLASIAIGGLTYGISPLEMAAAYAMIANDGTYIEPTFYSKVEDSDGIVVLEPGQHTERVCSVETAYLVQDMLTSVVEGCPGYGGTASYCRISGMDVAAKTGSTNEYKDRWLCGFTNYYAGAVWFGYDQPETIKSSGNPAGQIFAGVMKEIHKGKESSRFDKPENVVTATVCADSGRLASNKCTNKYSEIFIKGKLPKTCDAHKGEYTICNESGKLANEFCPADKKEVKSTGYVYEKETLGLWNTPEVKSLTTKAPTEHCTIHKKVEVVKPEEPEKKPETKPETKPEAKPENNTGTQQKPETKPEENSGNNTQQKPETKPENNTGNTNNTQQKPETNNGGNNTSSTGNTTNTGNTGNIQQNKPQT